MEKAVEVYQVEQDQVSLGMLATRGPAEVITKASDIAKRLAGIVEQQELYTLISGKKFVRVEGWTTLGAMLGVLPREVATVRIDDGSYESLVELVRVNDGMVVGRGSALCGVDEKRWKGADEYARRSMAITRATGKAYRLAFSWIMALAGYEPTPAEEVDSVDGQNRPTVKQKPVSKQPPKPPAKLKANPSTGNTDWKTAFWELAYGLGVSREDGLALVSELGNDFEKAVAALKSDADTHNHNQAEPLDAVTIIERLTAMMEEKPVEWQEQLPSDKAKGFLAAKMNEAFDGDEEKRRGALVAITGCNSITKLHKAWVMALLDAFLEGKDGDDRRDLADGVREELWALWRHREIERGQMELEIT